MESASLGEMKSHKNISLKSQKWAEKKLQANPLNPKSFFMRHEYLTERINIPSPISLYTLIQINYFQFVRNLFTVKSG